MTEQHDTFDRFDDLLAQSLQGDEQPSSDFTTRVMTEIRATPQRKRRSPYLKAVAGLAACAAVVILAIPLLSPKGSSMAPAAADCAAPADVCESITCDDAGDAAVCEETESVSELPQTPEKRKDDAPEDRPANVMMTASQREPDSDTIVFRPDDRALCDDAAVWLKEQGIEPQEDSFYHLSTDTATALAEAFPELKLPKGEVILDLGK